LSRIEVKEEITTKRRCGASAERVDDIDDEAMS
jgi:hypothetical protein